MCARKASAEGFWICARYALDVFLAGLLIAALNDLTIIHDRARRTYLHIARKIGSKLIPPNVLKKRCARKTPVDNFGICVGYAPD